ncbi:MAG: PEP-CTERM sorting domain-containing protein [Planctomycetes bacterium]|nr:PEP-CTERM sorting domain-containing protein [Planctomycetota bacterium]MBU4398430.1 PEP-CTERM sorting domain-containing protein [Planctomycetota bacterium]MCG2683064.1 PEP-CTERM sorting domain-containing protein [Planctomycetales bacterium]
MKRFTCVLAVLAIVGLAASIASASTIYPLNPGFETPDTTGAVEGTAANSSWTSLYSGDASGDYNRKFYIMDAAWASGAYSGGSWSGWVGDQVAQMLNHASINQDVGGFLAGPATVSLLAIKTSGNAANPLTVKLDDTVLTFSGLNTVTPPAGYAFALYTSDPITMTAGTHRLSITGLVKATFGEADTSTTIDAVSITTIPEPSALALLVTGLVGLLCYAWRKRK